MLLASVASLRVLATSRAPLRVRGEREYAVGPLALTTEPEAMTPAALARSPAVRLFMERVREVQPDFRLTSANASIVAAICRRLDALPLALELAARWMKVLTSDDLLRRLDTDVLLAAAGPRDLPERQQTMNATVAWSYRLLAPDEQRYMDRLNLLGGLQDETADDLSTMPDPEPSGDIPEFETFAVVQDVEEETGNSFDISEFETNEAPGSTIETPVSTFSDPTASFADLNEDVSESMFETPATEGDRKETVMRQELESVDFYIAQGYADIAVDTLEMLERQFGPHPDIQARREKLAASRDQQPAPAVFEFGDGGNNAKPVAPGIDAGLAELFEEFRVAEEGDDVSDQPSPEPPRPQAAPKTSPSSRLLEASRLAPCWVPVL